MKKLSMTKCKRLSIEPEDLILTFPSEDENIQAPIRISKQRNHTIDFLANDVENSNIENPFEKRKISSNKLVSTSSFNPPICFPILDKQNTLPQMYIYTINTIYINICIFIFIFIYIYIYSPVDPLDLKENIRRRNSTIAEGTQSMSIINEANSGLESTDRKGSVRKNDTLFHIQISNENNSLVNEIEEIVIEHKSKQKDMTEIDQQYLNSNMNFGTRVQVI